MNDKETLEKLQQFLKTAPEAHVLELVAQLADTRPELKTLLIKKLQEMKR